MSPSARRGTAVRVAAEGHRTCRHSAGGRIRRHGVEKACSDSSRREMMWEKFPFCASVRLPPMSDSRAELVLAAALRVIAPLVTLLLREGVTYTQFSNALKKSFLEAAPGVLEASSVRVNDSSVSTLTGIHRKDVRQWRSVGDTRPQAKAFGAAMAVFTRWTNDPEYCTKKGRPRVLDRSGGPGSFEALAASTSNDVHPFTLLQELVRLGVVRVEAAANSTNEKVKLCMDAFVPAEGTAEMLQLLADNVGDHLAAAVHNVSAGSAPMLEQSVFADNLRPESIEAMDALARQIWSRAFHEIVRTATTLSDKDQGDDRADQRLRVGMYFYHGPDSKKS